LYLGSGFSPTSGLSMLLVPVELGELACPDGSVRTSLFPDGPPEEARVTFLTPKRTPENHYQDRLQDSPRLRPVSQQTSTIWADNGHLCNHPDLARSEVLQNTQRHAVAELRVPLPLVARPFSRKKNLRTFPVFSRVRFASLGQFPRGASPPARRLEISTVRLWNRDKYLDDLCFGMP
jgi:hypothetical protein